MGYLLTVGVLAFQIVIFLTIVGAAAVGRGPLKLVAAAWVAFTLFGSIFTAGLLLLQLFTIAMAYSVGNAMTAHSVATQVQPAVALPRAEEEPGSIGSFWALVIVGGALWLAYIYVGAGNQESATSRTSPSALDTSTPEFHAVTSAPDIETTTNATQRDTSNQRGKQDLRHCLELTSNDAIAKCAEQPH